MKIVFIGCVQFSLEMLEQLLTLDNSKVEVVGIVSREQSAFNSDFANLIKVADRKGIPSFAAVGNDQQDMATWIKGQNPDVIFCFGWSYLLEKDVLEIPRLGVVGYHPTLLPQNRGRHPIVWALVNGQTETGSTFFFMDEGADSGDILSQRTVAITPLDTAATLYQRLVSVAKLQLRVFVSQLAGEDYPRTTQDHSKANYLRKRGKEDGRIDWNMPAESIFNLVRALTKPYVGAHFENEGKEFKVWEAQISENVEHALHANVGEVVLTENGSMTVRCGQGFLKLNNFAEWSEFESGCLLSGKVLDEHSCI